MTLECVQSILHEWGGHTKDMEVIVWDNASSDASASAIVAAFPQVKVLASAKNLGFAGANNEAARDAKGEWMLLLNPDTVVLDHAIDKLLHFAEKNPQVSIFGGRTLFANGDLNPASCWGKPTWWSCLCIGTGLTTLFRNNGLFNPEGYGGWDRNGIREVDIVSGCFFLLKKKLWEELGGFDRDFFMYGEEADLCLRAARQGHKCMVTPDATIIHHGGASEKVRSDMMVKLIIAKAKLYRRHMGKRGAWWSVMMLDWWAWSRMMALWLLAKIQRQRRDHAKSWAEIWARRNEWRSA
jgi:GT2 family glycosyltransferase